MDVLDKVDPHLLSLAKLSTTTRPDLIMNEIDLSMQLIEDLRAEIVKLRGVDF